MGDLNLDQDNKMQGDEKMQRRQRRKGKRTAGRLKIRSITAVLLAVSMLPVLVCGCGSGTQAGNAGELGLDGSAGEGQNSSRTSEAMGRYVEETIDLSEKLSGNGNALYQLSNGNLIISDKTWDFLKTGDGINWLTDRRGWRTEMIENGIYVMSLAVGADNTVGVIYQADARAETVTEAETDQTDSAAEYAKEEITAEDIAEDEDGTVVLNPRMLLIKPDNTEIPIDIALTEEDAYINQVYIADNGRIFVSTRGSANLYEVMEDGSSRIFLTLEDGTPDLIQFQDSLMVIDGYGYNGLVLYDMEQEEYIEDDVLNEFVETNYKNRDSSSGSFYDLYFFFGEDGILYLAGEKGLYRHVIGGSAMEQIIDGELCSLGNPSYGLQGMEVLADNEFLALFAGGKVIHYTYNPDISTIPSEKLRVYGLQDNETIRQAINLYQTNNPDVYIQFEAGMGGDDSVTREDALKRLNTQIMAGEGPDLFVLDSMPVDSYINKGLLLDLSPVLNDLSGEAELFGNIVDAVKTNDQVYMVPCEVRLPVMMAGENDLKQVNDLKDIADMTERMREVHPGEDLLGLCSEKSIMRLFSMTCAPAWTSESGELNQDAVREFLEQTKRIYDAQMDGLSDQAIDRYLAMAEEYMVYHGVSSFEDSDYVRMSGINMMHYIGGFQQSLYGGYDYKEIVSIQKCNGFETVPWSVMKGQSSNVFWAETLLGINAASPHTERAEDFLRVCLGKENQSYLYDSLPVNQAAFDESFVPEEGEVDSDGMWGSVVTQSEEGLRIVLVYYWPDEEQIAAYRACMEMADTAYIEDVVLEDAVYEAGISYMQDDCSLEEAVGAVQKKMAIYMAE